MSDLPQDHLAEHYLILLKSARRCAYDLRHAASDLTNDYCDFGQRAGVWLSIFAPDGVKNYRLELHQEIFRLECEVKRLAKLCQDNGIEAGASWIDE